MRATKKAMAAVVLGLGVVGSATAGWPFAPTQGGCASCGGGPVGPGGHSIQLIGGPGAYGGHPVHAFPDYGHFHPYNVEAFGYGPVHGSCGPGGCGSSASSWFSLSGVKNSIHACLARPCPSNAPVLRQELPLGFPNHPYARSPRDFFMVE